MLIILEGPDLAGKSTLANRLLTFSSAKWPERKSRLLHRGPPSSALIDEYVTPLVEYLPGGDEHIICDRWHLGEVVYPKVTGRPTEMTLQLWLTIEEFLDRKGALLVHVNAPKQTLMARYEERGDDVQSLRTVLAAAEAFTEACRASRLPKLSLLTYNPEHITSVATGLEVRAEEQEKRDHGR